MSDQPRRSSGRTFQALWPYLWPRDWRRRGIFLFAFLTLAASRLFALAAPFFYKESVDGLTPSTVSGAAVLPLGFILAYGAARMATQLTNYGRNLVFEPFLLSIADDIRLRFFAHLHSLSLRFHLERQTGALTMALERGVNGMRYIIENMVFNIIPTMIELILVSGLLAELYTFSYAGIILITVFIYGGVTHWLTKKRDTLLRNFLGAHDHTNTVTMDSLLNYETVKYYVKEQYEVGRLKESRLSLRTALLKHLRAWQNLSLIQGAIVTGSLCAAMSLAAHQVLTDHVTVGDYVLINTYLLQLFAPLGALGSVYIESKRAFVDMEAMLALFDTTPELADKPGAEPLKVTGGEIRLEDVHFAYDPQRKILNGISFTVPAGRRTAIVGATGSGKSTIAKLLFRFYDLTGGRILIDGQDISQVTQGSLRSAIGVVPQDTVLFNDTIYYNIAYGSQRDNEEPSRDMVERAAKLAQLHEFIVSLPQSYETHVGERGLKLSGGEKQRVAIARTILKAPRIFLLDEATSALDNKTEAEIQTSLRAVAADSTTLVIAHRLSTIVDADEIIVLDQGQVVERGHHEILLAAEGAYARMWHRQEDAFDLSN